MLKNTYYLILFLSVLAALVIGLNIGKKMQTRQKDMGTGPTPSQIIESPEPTPFFGEPTISATPAAVATQSATVQKGVYTNTLCKITLSYPDTVSVEESSTDINGALFTNRTNPKDVIVLTCQKDIPKPPLPASQIEDKLIGSISAKLYHDSSQKDGTNIDALIFTHPKTKLDVFIGGYGATFNGIIQSIKIL